MCLATLDKTRAFEQRFGGTVPMNSVSFGDIISLEMAPQTSEGDYALMQMGVAMSVVNEKAKRNFFYLLEIGELTDISHMLPD